MFMHKNFLTFLNKIKYLYIIHSHLLIICFWCLLLLVNVSFCGSDTIPSPSGSIGDDTLSCIKAFDDLSINSLNDVNTLSKNIKDLHDTVSHSKNGDITLKKDQVEQLFKVLDDISTDLKKIAQNTQKKQDNYLVTVSKETIIHTIKTIISLIAVGQK